jgi:hypothetical protein
VTIIADSDWAHDIADRKSFSGSCVIVDGALINFITAQQPTVSTSSTEAEYISTFDACREGLYFRNLIPELITVALPIKASLDNIGAGYIVQNHVNNSSRTKHIDVKYHMVRDWIVKKVFELFHIESNKNLADIFTKARAGSTCTSRTGSSSSWWTFTPLVIELFLIESTKNLADIFTKALAAPAHRGLAHRLLAWWTFTPLVISQGCVRGICTERTT